MGRGLPQNPHPGAHPAALLAPGRIGAAAAGRWGGHRHPQPSVMQSTRGEPKALEELPEGSAALLSCWQPCFLPGLTSLFGCNLSQGVCGDGPGQGGAVGTQRLHSRPSHCSSFTRDEHPGSSFTWGRKQLCPCGRDPQCHPVCRGQPGENRASRRRGCGRAGRQHTVPAGSEPMPPAWPCGGSSCAQHHEHRALTAPAPRSSPRRGRCLPWLVALWEVAAGVGIMLRRAELQRANMCVNEPVNLAELLLPSSQTCPAPPQLRPLGQGFQG